MASDLPDEAHYRFLTVAGANVDVGLAPGIDDFLELQIFGNRAGILSLANILLWFRKNAWRREFFSLSELSFV